MSNVNLADINAQIALLQSIANNTFNPAAKLAALKEQEQQRETLSTAILNGKAELYRASLAANLPTPDDSTKLTDEILLPKLKIALPCFPKGASGKTLANFIADHRITTDDIKEYQERTHILLRKGEGLNTVYTLATAEETAALVKEDEEEAARVAAQEAARVAAEKAAKEAKKKGGKKK